MKKFALLLLALICQLNYSQTTKNFESQITFGKKTPQGCLDAYYGRYPEANFIPDCTGREEQIHVASLYSSYSTVSVTAGVEYSFITYSNHTANNTTFISISNEEGNLVYASGYDLVKWTPSKDETIRFYVHADDQCGKGSNLDYVKKYIRCGTIPAEPTYGCDQTYDGPFWVACSVSGDAGYLTADDFFVPKDSEAFNLKSIKLLLVPLAGTEDFKNFTFEIRKDSNNSPGDIVASYENLDNLEITQTSDDIQGFPTYWANFTIPNNGLSLPVDHNQNTRYWMTVQVWSKTNNNIGIVNFHRINGWETAPTFQSLDDRATWITTTWEEDPGLESNWSFDAECSLMGTSESNTDNLTYYPNPVKDVLNISSFKNIKEISILSYTGQKLMEIKNFNAGQINLSSLKSGNYLLNIKFENEKIKVIKIQKL